MKELPARSSGRATGTALVLAALCGCQELLPVVESEDLTRPGFSIELILSFDEFAETARVYGGYGRASELAGGFVAHEFGGQSEGGGPRGPGLEAATLMRFGRYPRAAQVLDTTGTLRPDSSLTFLSGRVLARFDTIGSVREGPVEVVAHALSEPWDGVSATWEYSVDTVGHRVAWSRPGGGLVEEIASAVWDPETGDSVGIPVDSAWIAQWADTTDLGRGVRLSTTTPGVRLRVTGSVLRLDTRPSVNPDTIIVLPAGPEATTFIYAPAPSQPRKTLRVGGAPAWRTVLSIDIPRVLEGPGELCDAVGCPVEIGEDHVSFAALRLVTRAGARAFAPSDTLSIDVRSVLAPQFLPKSPLGPSRLGLGGKWLSHELFEPPAGELVEIALTSLVRDLLRGETAAGDPITNTVALLSTFEPVSLEYHTFEGAASPDAPGLRLILNFSREN
ncbi:MAG: hypothetical protein OXU64_11055 [Gemmatimonadota bacterium]|nr:hypothetical protein [Gemmatimonadota bacterium]